MAAATSIAMAKEYQVEMPYVFNRKEAKDYGEGGTLVGATMEGQVVIVDDVITAGTAIREVMSLLDLYPNAQAIAVVVAIAIEVAAAKGIPSRDKQGTNVNLA